MRIVCIGGGTGLHAELTGLKAAMPDAELAAVVAMTDAGSNSGKLRDEFGYLPPGDVRQVLTALSDAPLELRQLMQYRFKTERSDLDGYVVGNIILTALKDIHGGDEYAAIKAAERILNLRGSVYPVTVDNAHVVAELDDGTILRGEGKLYGEEQGERRICRICLEPQPSLFPATRQALLAADYIIIGPGTLHSSILPNLLVAGMVDALKAAKENGAKIIFVANTMTKHGDSDGFKASDLCNAIQQALDGARIDAVICNTGQFPQEQIEAYMRERAAPVECDISSSAGLLVVTGDFVAHEAFMKHGKATFARHDPQKLAQAIKRTVVLLGKSNILDLRHLNS